jgi:hypothetical protein
VVIRIITIQFFAAQPTKVGIASGTSHFVAAINLFARRFTFWALCNRVHHAINFESRIPI